MGGGGWSREKGSRPLIYMYAWLGGIKKREDYLSYRTCVWFFWLCVNEICSIQEKVNIMSVFLYFPLISWYSSSNIKKGMFSADSQTVYYPNAKNFIRLRFQTSSYLNYMYVYNIRLKLSYFKLWILNFVMLMMTGLYLL